ncbi:P-loop containing nucleoside triphosphate hydrolase protein [Collybia nuda]|uniref:ATP-dependent RNA helicase n=1 Tax=Collybia nuda TaxID=64659 RepID=A0A9P5XYB8_9AGAR|nr:P-loop containing nucleoside triphosphate hydrolase protein [Collybia nuda]
MASLLARVCTSRSTRAVCSVSVVRRSLITSSSKPIKIHVNSLVQARKESSLATAERLNTAPSTASAPSPLEPPHFSTLKGRVSERALQAIISKPMNLTHMSPVQAEVFPLLPELADPYDPETSANGPPRDLLVKAKTGTGKTLAFLLPAVEARLKALEAHGKQAVVDAGLTDDKQLEHRAQQAFARENVGTLIISPTRELATQIATEAMRLTSHLDGFQVRLFVGGDSKRMQMRDWMRGRRDIVVATPGRLRDCLESEPEVARGISQTQLLILDEADTLLDMGFRPDIEAIKERLPPVPRRQTFLFSATVSRSIQQIAQSTLAPNHQFINCVSSDSSPVHAHIPQYHTVLPDASHQIPHVLRLIAHDQLTNPGSSKIIIFLPTTKMTQLFTTIIGELAKTSLPAGRNTTVYELHSKRAMESRKRTSAMFRSDTSGASVLITSDVSARGVDYPGVSRVIQIGIPGGTEQYIHRVGRTGRAGATSGRGDLVLLPWELNFASQQLSMVPLKPLSAGELSKQASALAKQFDADPKGFFANAPIPAPPSTPSPRGSRGRPITGSALFNEQAAASLEEVESNVTMFVNRLDEESVKETFMSLLGYYISRTGELRIEKQEVVQNCKSWAVEACGLQTPPYVSAAFLAKLGVGSDYSSRKPRSFGKPRADSWGSRGSATPGRRPSWASEGRHESRESGEEGGYRSRGSSFSREGSSRWGGRGSGNSEGGYGGRSESGYRGRSEGGYKGRSEGGYGGRGDGGYGGRGDGGYGGSRGGYRAKETRSEEPW